MDRFYTVSEISKMLSVSKRSIQRWIKEGEIKAIFVGNKYIIEEAELKAFLAARTHR